MVPVNAASAGQAARLSELGTERVRAEMRPVSTLDSPLHVSPVQRPFRSRGEEGATAGDADSLNLSRISGRSPTRPRSR